METVTNAPLKTAVRKNQSRGLTANGASSTTTSPNIGPGALGDSSEANGPGFTLSSSEWLAIQAYVTNALALPTTDDAFRSSLGSGAPSDLSDFEKLITAYANINAHVTDWQNNIFPATVSLASDIHSYAQQAPAYYNPILPLAQALQANPNDEQSKQELAAILNVLSASATKFHDNAAAVAASIQQFSNETTQDKIVLSGTDGKSGLLGYYNNEYGATSQDVVNLTEQLKTQQGILAAANAEYAHDVIVASTTPTYAWWFPLGTIAAGVVAGVYGDKAVKALNEAKAAQQQINTLSAQLAADANLMSYINTAEFGMTSILASLNAALPIIQKIQGVWGAIADDLNNIVGLITTNIAQVPPIIMNLGVQTAITDWTSVGNEANAYRLNAYITVQK